MIGKPIETQQQKVQSLAEPSPIGGQTKNPRLKRRPPLLKSNTAEVAILAHNVPQLHQMSLLKEDFRRMVQSLFPNMSPEQQEEYIEEGFKIDSGALRAQTFKHKSAAQPNKPLAYTERPPGMKFEDFMRHEYLQKGIIGPGTGFTLKMLRDRDPSLAIVYYKQIQRGNLPPEIYIPKATSRQNKRERDALNRIP